jgi:serine/threonine protein kinase
MVRKTRVRSRHQRKSRRLIKTRKGKKQHKKVHGGSIIGQGSFGCVYKPSLRCAADLQPEENNVSKLIYRRNLLKEKGPAVLPEINAAQEYFVYPRMDCPFNSSIQTNYNEICTAVNKTKGNRHLLIMKDGGVEPDNIMYQPEDYYKFFDAFSNVFTAVQKLHERGYVHHDIKPSNMLVKVNEDGAYKIRLIDFGLVRNLEEDVNRYFDNDMPIYTNTGRNGNPISRYSMPYDYYPFTTDILGRQLSFFKDKRTNELRTDADFWLKYNNFYYKNWRKTTIQRQTYANAAMPLSFYLPEKLRPHQYGTAEKRGYMLLLYDTLSRKENLTNYMKNIDYYSIAVTFLELIFLFFNITISVYQNPNGSVDYTKCRPLIRNDAMTEQWSTPAQQKYQDYETLNWPRPDVLVWFKSFTEPEGSFLQQVYKFVQKLMLWDFEVDSLDNQEIVEMYITDILSSLEESLFVGGESSGELNPEFVAYLSHARPDYIKQYLGRITTPENQQSSKRGRY